MSEPVMIALFGAVANGLVTWGVMSTKLAWHKSLLDDHAQRIRELEARPCTPS